LRSSREPDCSWPLTTPMFARALFAFIAMPGMVAFAIPAVWLWRSGRLEPEHPAGLLLLAIGTAGLLWCVRDFYVHGKGTLAPWSPPRDLVVGGLYRHSRNPMYVCVVAVLLGWAAAFASAGLAAYAVLIGLAFHLRVVHGEEPWLARRHGAAWGAYARDVPRWLHLGHAAANPWLYVAWAILVVVALVASYFAHPHIFGFTTLALAWISAAIGVVGLLVAVRSKTASPRAKAVIVLAVAVAGAVLIAALEILGRFRWA
jgi:protein-S-isoprenylcysteine O-methyltransferase Ste14